MKRARALHWPVVFILGLASNVANAVPANPATFAVKQPDGTTIRAVMRGDEYQGWMETVDGYTIVKNRGNGAFEYAVMRAGALVPSGVVVGPSAETTSSSANAARVRSKGLRPARNERLLQSQNRWIGNLKEKRPLKAAKAGQRVEVAGVTGTWEPREVVGDRKLLVVLVNFKDAALLPGAAAHWSKAFFDARAQSVARFFSDNSHKRVRVLPIANKQDNAHPGIVIVSLKEEHPDCQNKCQYDREKVWVNRALSEAARFVDIAGLDANGNGTVDADEAVIYFVLGGYEAASSPSNPSIWAHRWGGDGVSVAGKKIDNWALSGEMHDDNSRLAMGTIAHELGHAMFGLPDLYDISNTNGGLGPFSAMSYGSWGARDGELNGTTPVTMDAWTRHFLGWSNPRIPANAATLSLESGLSSERSAVLLMNASESTSEYWFLENRHPVGWDAGMARFLEDWKGGALIQHIDANVGTREGNSFNEYTSGRHQGNTVVEPSSAKCNLLVRGHTSCPTLLYFSGNADTYDGSSNPNSTLYSGKQSGFGITAISAPGPKMQATIQLAP